MRRSPFNRTTMELKRRSAAELWRDIFTFNRTTMELKQDQEALHQEWLRLLIEPLWN